MSALPAVKRGYSWADYLAWPESERWEIIGGEAFGMSPAPLSRHQFIVGRLAAQWFAFLDRKPCELWLAPMAVRLSDQDVVEPDLFVVCDPRQVKRTHIEGPPALVVEVLSERTMRHDRVRKYRLYERCGVREYWVVQPYPSLVEVYLLVDGHYRLDGGYEKHDVFRSPSFPALRLDLGLVFAFALEPGEDVSMLQESTPPYAVDAIQSEPAASDIPTPGTGVQP
jgi:Uma2 family endonuclease